MIISAYFVSPQLGLAFHKVEVYLVLLLIILEWCRGSGADEKATSISV